MIATSARLLRVLTLLQSRRSWSARDLAERLEVTERTVRRDIDRLRTLGYPVEGTAGVAGGYQLGAGASLPPLLLDDREAVAVAIGLRTAANGTIAGIEDAAQRALTKLEQVLPKRLQKRVKVLHSAVTSLPNEAPRIDGHVLSILAESCRNHEEVRFSYGGLHTSLTERRVEPHGLVHTGSRWYLVGWDRTREDFRTFRLDRIVSVPQPGARFTPHDLPERDLTSYVSKAVSTQAYPIQARVILHAPYAAIRAKISPSAGHLEPIDDQRCRLATGGRSAEIIGLWIATLGVPFEVEEPAELVDQLVHTIEVLQASLRVSRRSPAATPEHTDS